MASKKIGIGVGIVAIIIIIGALATMEFSDTAISDGLTGEIKIGLILPLTGDLSSHGNDNWEAAKYGVIKFNEYLDEIDAPWDLVMLSEDSATNPVVALDKVTVFNSKGIGLIVGPEPSANVKSVKGYTDSNNMMVISCCSSAPVLAIPGDSVFRLAPDDSNQGTAIAKLVEDSGVENIIIAWRGDVWGDGLSQATKDSFESRGGKVIGEGIRYNPELPEFSSSVSLLAAQVQKAVDEYGAAKVAVVYIAFGEVLQFMQAASAHDILDDVRWFGPAAYTRDHELEADPIGVEFATAVQITTVQVRTSESAIVQDVDNYVQEQLGRLPNTFAHAAYDSVWLFGLAMLQTQSSDPAVIKEVIIDVAAEYEGAIGGTNLNEAGDLANSDFNVWQIIDGKWIEVGRYTFADDAVTFN